MTSFKRGAVSRWGVRVAAVTVVTLLTLAGGSAAMAETPQEGFWYFDVFHVQDAHDAGITGAGVTIAVLDSQINLEVPTLKGADIEVQPSRCFDESGVLIPPTSTSLDAEHGTSVTSLIVGTGAGYPGQSGVKGVAPKAKVLYFMASPSYGSNKVIECRGEGGTDYPGDINADYVDSAVAMGAQIISVSLGVGSSPALSDALARALHQGVVILGALPNTAFAPDGGFQGDWPAAANGVVAVQRIDANSKVPMADRSDFDDRVVVAGPGQGILAQGSLESESWETQRLADGTSFATPVVAGFLALVKQKYPKSTGNQLIQSLINNTGLGDHPLSFSTVDGLGYGPASATSMLAVDPTQYPDVNPLVKTDAGWEPSAEMIANPPGVNTPNPSESAPAKDAAALPWLLPVVIGGVVFFLLLIIGLIILVVVLASRRAKRSQGIQ